MKTLTLATLLCIASFGFSQDRTVPAVDEVGVYYLNSGAWTDIPPEVVNWQTGGVIKHMVSAGIVHGDVNGRIRKPVSPTRLVSATQLLVYVPDGAAITEYQLIRLHSHPDSREFRTVTGGVFHVSGGSQRDTLDFESKRVAKRTYMIELRGLDTGEYGLLPPGLTMPSSASAQLGKMYTFSISSTKSGRTFESAIRETIELQANQRVR